MNAYVEPLVSLDLDLAVAVDQIGQIRTLLQPSVRVEEFPHSLRLALTCASKSRPIPATAISLTAPPTAKSSASTPLLTPSNPHCIVPAHCP